MGFRQYYFQFTLNDYVREGLEPNVPPVAERIDTFKRLADRVGKERVIWRFDPLMLGCAAGTKPGPPANSQGARTAKSPTMTMNFAVCLNYTDESAILIAKLAINSVEFAV